MSIETWKKEFYPVEACDVPTEEALDASILKWRGVLDTHLKKHKLTRNGITIIGAPEEDCFELNADTCALCTHYIDENCEGCPLYLSTGKTCDGISGGSPWQEVVFGKKSPKVMVNALLKAKKEHERSQKPEITYEELLWMTEDDILKREDEVYKFLNNLPPQQLQKLLEEDVVWSDCNFMYDDIRCILETKAQEVFENNFRQLSEEDQELVRDYYFDIQQESIWNTIKGL